MTNPDDVYYKLRLDYLIDDTVIAHAHSIHILHALEPSYPRWKRVGAKVIYNTHDARDDLAIQASQFPQSRGFPSSLVNSHLS